MNENRSKNDREPNENLSRSDRELNEERCGKYTIGIVGRTAILQGLSVRLAATVAIQINPLK